MKTYYYEVYLFDGIVCYDYLEDTIEAESELEAKKKIALIVDEYDPSVTGWKCSIEECE